MSGSVKPAPFSGARSLATIPDRSVIEDFIRESAASDRETNRNVAVLIVDFAKVRLALDVFGANCEGELILTCARRAYSVLANQAASDPPSAQIDPALWDSSLLLGRGRRGELVIVFSGIDDPQFLQRIARKVIAAFAAPLPLQDQVLLKLEASVGIAVMGPATEYANRLLSSARLAVRNADQRGPGHYAFYQTQQRLIASERLCLEATLPGVMARGDLHLHYQPKVDLMSGRVVGVEALARARDEQGHFVNPQSFIEAAEKCGMIEDIGRAVLQMAISQCRQWLDRGFEVPVAINASALQFARPGFSRDVLNRIDAAGLPPQLVEIELTETAATGNAEATRSRIGILREAGVKVAIDDFGTGYANVAQFAQFDFDTLKFDRSLIEMIGKGARGEALLAGLLAMAETVGHQVVAEGVETPEQKEFLIAHGCPVAQGYLFARPMTPADCTAWIESAGKVAGFV